jgi:hypothetical protein
VSHPLNATKIRKEINSTQKVKILTFQSPSKARLDGYVTNPLKPASPELTNISRREGSNSTSGT